MSDNTHQVRRDGALFPSSYLSTANPEIAANYLWPIPVFQRHRDEQAVHVGDTEIRPGDILEACDTDYEEFLLVVSLFPEASVHDLTTASPNSDRFLLYSSNTQTFRVFDLTPFTDTHESGTIKHPQAHFAVHDGAATTVEQGDTLATTATAGTDPVTGTAHPSDRLTEQFPYANPPRSICPGHGVAPFTDKLSLEDCTNNVFEGDAEEVLQQYPTDAVHAAVFSPPYLAQRDYDVDGQLGLEDSIDAYLEELISVSNQTMRVVRDDGTAWIVLDDSYDDGALAGIPDRLVGELKTEGYDVIVNGPWIKDTTPDPATKRYSHTHERIIGFTKDAGDHFFEKRNSEDHEDVFTFENTPSTDTNHDAVYPIALPREIIKAAVPNQVCATCGTPYEPVYEVTDIRDLKINRTGEGKPRAVELANEKGLTDDHLWALYSRGISDGGQAARTMDGAGENSERVQQLAAEADEALGGYARDFASPEKHHTGFEKQCCCPDEETKEGIVLDPFFGSGTTACAAKDEDCRWTGVELNPEYISEAEERIQTHIEESDHLTTDSQETLTDWA